MEKNPGNNKQQKLPSATQFMEAEKLITAGIIARLNNRYKASYGKDAARYAVMAAGKLFDILPDYESANTPTFAENDIIDSMIKGLSDDSSICSMLTQVFVMRVVYASRLSGCRTENLYAHIEKLKNLGLYFEEGKPPTPQTYFTRVQEFFLASPNS